MTSTAANLYTPLDTSTWQIRILRLLPDDFGSVIRCELQTHTIFAPPRFIALSYCWGDESDRRPAIVNEISITITASLEAALQQLRQFGVEMTWVDALCINQQDLQERGLQVRFMRQIYSKADATYAWLGPAQQDNAMAGLRFLEQLCHDPTILSEVSSESNNQPSMFRRILRTKGTWPTQSEGDLEGIAIEPLLDQSVQLQSLQDLFDRPYWQRRWIIQEAVVSKTTRILCGDMILDLDLVATALQHCTGIRAWTSQHETSYHFIDRIVKIRRFHQIRQQPGLIRTIFETKTSLSKDQRDKVFALIGICKDGDALVPTPNYEESSDILNISLTKELLRRNGAVDLTLLRGPKDNEQVTLPSWCPDWLAEDLPKWACIMAEKEPRLLGASTVAVDLEDHRRLIAEGIQIGDCGFYVHRPWKFQLVNALKFRRTNID